MKRYNLLIITILCWAFSSCNDWLDVTPADSVTEEKLYETGQGYRNALNGVYKQMATEAMYGCEMSFGLVDVMGAMYTSYNIPSTSKYYAVVQEYNYTGTKIKPVIEEMWSKTYNSIANCNNMIERIAKEDAGTFAGGKLEQEMIQGEALALRALLHFDMLRLFAPARVKDDQKKYLPYFENYPSYFEPYLSVEEILAKVRRDLEAAKELVAPFDTIPEHAMWMMVRYRFEGNRQTENGQVNMSDLFYTYRGYRMNYYAICALLARVYNYSGMYKEASDLAQQVIEAEYQKNRLFTFTNLMNVMDGNRKLYDDLIFALSNTKMFDIYETANTSGDNLIFSLNNYWNLFDDPGDIRKSLTEKVKYDNFCNKYLKPVTGGLVKYAQDMIPMIRMSEMYYIQAEYEMSVENWAAAAQKLDKVREGRSCTIGNLKISDRDSFIKALLAEANREFMCEGQLFYYYKKLGLEPSYSMSSDEQFYLPLPDNETIH